MSAYAIVQINVTNKEPYKEYIRQATPIIEKYKGKYLVRGGKFQKMIGEWNYDRTVIVKFPSYEIAMKWYNSKEYAPIKKIRENNSDGNLIIIEGV